MLLVILLLGVVAVTAYASSPADYLSPSTVLRQPSQFTGRLIEVKGSVVPTSVVTDGNTSSFSISDSRRVLPVLYAGPLPELFGEGKTVVVRGTLQLGGPLSASLLAKEIIIGCPSKYQAATGSQ